MRSTARDHRIELPASRGQKRILAAPGAEKIVARQERIVLTLRDSQQVCRRQKAAVPRGEPLTGRRDGPRLALHWQPCQARPGGHFTERCPKSCCSPLSL